jgi:cell division protein FtsB
MTEHQPAINNPLADIIAAKNETIATQKETIAALQREVDMLRQEIDRLKSSEFSLVVADNTEPD